MRTVLTLGFLLTMNLPFRMAFRICPAPKRSTVGNRHALNAPASSSSSESTQRVQWGGNYAGHLASFHPKTGALLPLPEYYVPEALKEWGQIPTSLEILTSEETGKLQRLQALVLPETGCGIDNLETIVSKQSLQPTHQQEGQSLQKGRAVGYLVSEPKDGTEATYFEAAFAHSIEEDVPGSLFRCRVAVPIEIGSKPINMVIERWVEEVKEEEAIADTSGGGLDGQSVARWLGTNLSSGSWRAFAESASHSNESSSLSLPLGVHVDRQEQLLTISKIGHGSISFALASAGVVSERQP